MAEIRALIVDDEPLARRGIRQLLAPHPDIVVAGECRDGREAVRALATVKPDLLFLDIQMPGLDGMGVIRVHGAERMPLTVFVTAHDEFAVRAFEAQALDYLVKPLTETRFNATIARVRERIRVLDALALGRKLSALLEADGAPAGSADRPTARPTDTRIAVTAGAGERLLDGGDIDWIGARDDRAVVHARGQEYEVSESLSGIEARLDPAQFARIHRGAIVRLDRVREWRRGPGDEAVLVLRDGTELPVSRRRLAGVKALLRGPGRS